MTIITQVVVSPPTNIAYGLLYYPHPVFDIGYDHVVTHFVTVVAFVPPHSL